MTDRVDDILRQSEEMHWGFEFLQSEAFTGFLDLIPEAAVLSSEAGNIVLTNKTANALFGYDEAGFKQCVVEDLVPKSIHDVHVKFRANFFADPKPRFLQGRETELCGRKKTGDEFPMESALFSIQTDRGPVAVNLIRDVTAEKEEQRKISEYAFVDALTNLPNRRYFDAYVKQTVEKSSRHEQGLALLYFDLDHFKPINDNFGHEAGDAVLQEITKRLAVVIRKEDFLARVGGDEFALLVYPIGDALCLPKVAERILSACQEPVYVGENTCKLSASIGICVQEGQITHEQELVRRADQAMYQAKEKGKGCFVFWEA
jgi:diguanylate cyclase (GGDEF)-like protein/PAS domain S-box-containing protein